MLELNEKGLFDKSSQADHIAVLAVYMPILREDIQKFARIWNIHTIRRQPRRPNCVAGQPVMLYHWPSEGVKDHGARPDPDLRSYLQTQVSDWGKLTDQYNDSYNS